MNEVPDFVPDELDEEPVSIEEAARQCGLTVDEFFKHLVADGLLIQHGPDEYEPVHDHGGLVRLEESPSPFDR